MGCFHPVSHARNVEDKSVIMQTCQIALQSPECEVTEAICLCAAPGSTNVTSVTASVTPTDHDRLCGVSLA